MNDDFRADNAIEIELDEKAHVQARKEPSLVEIIAYKDTWRQGLDSFVSMPRSRLMLLKQLLAPSGMIIRIKGIGPAVIRSFLLLRGHDATIRGSTNTSSS